MAGTPRGLSHLRDAEADEARRFFVETPAEELVERVRASDDDALGELIADDVVRTAALLAILARLGEFAVPERLAELTGLVRLDLAHGRRRESHTLAFTPGQVDLLAENADVEAPDVVLSTSVLGFVRLVSGERNAALELLAGDLDVDGDALLALGVGGVFRVPGRDSVAVDPAALDPVDVASALARVPSKHLRKLMAGGFRPVVLDEVFRRLPDFVDPRRAARHDLTVGFRLTGAEDGEPERYVVRVVDGVASVTEGEEGDRRDATIICSGADFLRLATGHLAAVTGVLKGQLKVRGDRAKALQLSSMIDFPQARG